jgi:SAM-dependent methyltransferase
MSSTGSTMDSAVSRWYKGDAGQTYASWQIRMSERLAAEPARRFARYIQPSDIVVDFGCGGGSIISEIQCAKRVGIEPNEFSRDRARARGLEVHSSSIEVEDGSADVVMSCHALEHCQNPFDELVGLGRILRSGGKLVLLLPIDDWRKFRRWRSDEVNHHLFTWNPQLIGNLLSDAGFQVVDARVVTHAWPPKVGAILWDLLPHSVFDLLARSWSVASLARQVLVVAQKDVSGSGLGTQRRQVSD